MLSKPSAARLKPHLDAFFAGYDQSARVAFDPVELPHRYRRPEDVELVALVSASLAYGRADLFKPKLEGIFRVMGESPSAYAQDFRAARDAGAFRDFVYRFNLGADIATLIAAAGALQREHGTLGALFSGAFARRGTVQLALAELVGGLKAFRDPGIERRLGKPRDLAHLLPDPASGSACKRLALYLRWMIRGPDAIDFGLWAVPKSALVIPLDTHILRISRFLGLTRRNDASWRTAEDVTASLRLLDPEDPVKYDFALCHYGMSGSCPARVSVENCRGCALLAACRKGGPLVARAAPKRPLLTI